mmetsp:Transcript_36849/g.115341  ORF Transcript_36849/g.115341 Transcript_36849/m.115341 type:complete len:449 (-) Transcript_36849:154-1500(-)|eukprot:CAMPEP_0118870328 /NCGR_PEP_ID=MMETSP1163-20130328/13328_1 /TAXON_ID=124430 /ORGANISM="Phaeomonas parva, Strain CCMP2877" /LENGTH=448 /DNA_ID=CAMNT_0006805323 /DNA_START=91 /DNA_END=1437 /DNA_ORIENTATION=+
MPSGAAAAALLLALPAASAFSGLRMAATVNAPTRTIPGAGVRPEWANAATPKEDYMRSDPAAADLSGLRECPLTRWNSEVATVEKAQAEARAAVKRRGAFPLEIQADETAKAQGIEYFKENADKIREAMAKHGCVWLRGFDVTKDVAGYRQMWEELGLLPCLDPIHSSGLRKFASERDGLYEEVNKPALRQHYIGLHQESTAKRTAAAAAFVCFQKATEEGGRFTIADGAAVLADMKTDTLKRLYEDGVRISVSNLDTPFKSTEGIVGAMREGFKGLVQTAVAPKFDMDLEMVYEADGKPGRLQAVESREPPINRHPESGVPVWFCNAHNHMRYLRDRRPCGVPEVGMTDVFLGEDMKEISAEDCEEVKRVAEKNIVALPMEPGDVLLIDNYRALHGRETFEGDRYHAVTWFTWNNPEWREGANENSEEKDGLNKVMNKYLDWLPKEF